MKRTWIRRLLPCLLALVCLLQTGVGAISYEDTRELTEEEQAVLTDLYDLNLMQGSGTSFRADAYMTYQELCRVVYSIAVGGEVKAPDAYFGEKLLAVSGLTDTAEISAWALPYVGYCFFNKLWIGDASGALQPRSPVTYYDCASMLLKLLGMPATAQTTIEDKVKMIRYAMDVGLVDSKTVDNVLAPMTRLDVAKMIHAALNVRCISSVENGTLRYASEIGLKRWFRANSVDQLRKSGVVTGKTTENGQLFLMIRSGKSEYRYPATTALYGEMLGKIVRWSETRSGEILSPLRADVPYTSARLEDVDYRSESGGVIVTMGDSELTFERNLINNSQVYLLNMATGEATSDRSFLTMTSLLKELCETVGTQYGMQTVIDLSATADLIVVRIFPRVYLRYDSTVGSVRSDTAIYPAADPKFFDVPDGSIVAALVNCASNEIVLEEVLAPLNIAAADFGAVSDEDGNYTFTIGGRAVYNRTASGNCLTDAELAAYAANGGSGLHYIMLDGDGIAAVGSFAAYRLPYTNASAYMFVTHSETVTIGAKTYTVLHGFINGKPACELIDAAYATMVRGENRLFALDVETASDGSCVVRPQAVSTEAHGLSGKVGIGTLTESLFVDGIGREITVDDKVISLTDDCVIVCAEANGTPDTYRLADLLVLDGKGRDDHRDHAFRAVYGLGDDGSATWLMLIRSPIK